MEPVAISWLVASATSPLIAVLSLWTVYVFHTYRKRWRTVDLFLLAVTSQELVSALFNFGYAIVSLINPPIPALCSFIHWGVISVRTFQIATLTSMVVDRALTVRWPYRYRFSVRRNQIRYHIAVLALMSILVGIAAVFAHNPQNGLCSTHPKDWDFKFVVFVLGFYGAMVVLSIICILQVEVHKCRNGGVHEDKSRPFQLENCAVPSSAASPLDNDSHTGSTKALHRPHRHSSRRPYSKRAAGSHSDFRWPPVAVVSLVCFSVNHLPYLVLTSLATAMPWLWSLWHEALLCWLRLTEGAIVPLILCVVDQHLRLALKRTFQRRSGALSPLVGDDGPFQMYFDKDHFRKRGTFGSVTPIGIITNYRRTPGKKRGNRKCKYRLPGLHSGDSVIEKSCLAGTFLSTEPLSKLSCADLTSLEVWQEEDEENFYAAMSDDFSNFSANSTDENDANDEAKICEDVYGGSFTTIANDDFEFHDTRPCGGEVKMKPAMPITVQPSNSFRGSFRSVALTRGVPLTDDDIKYRSMEKIPELMQVALPPDDCTKDPYLFLTNESLLDPEPDLIKTDEENCRSSTTLSKATSYSMNDIDLIEKDDGKDKEKVFVLPVKSESTMSLYRLNLGQNIDQLVPSTKSESNINGDSGFHSATQTINSIWPNYPVQALSNHCKIGYRHYPGVMHPRMQKIPWISAWKKLGSSMEVDDCRTKNRKDEDLDIALRNEETALRMMLITDNFELRQNDALQWKESDIYAKEASDPRVEHASRQSKPKTEPYAYGSVYYKERHYNNNEPLCNNKPPRRESFKSQAPKPQIHESPYGKIKDTKSASMNVERTNCPPEENIYEEIIGTKSENKNLNSPSIEDRSYAQTDILNLVGTNPQPNEFKLNINVGQPQLAAFDPTLPFSLSHNVSKLVIDCPPMKYVDNINYNNKVHVTYNANDSDLEFIDRSEENIYQPIPYPLLDEADLNANCSQTYPIENPIRYQDLRFYKNAVTSAVSRRDSKKSSNHEANVKRRDSRKGKRDTYGEDRLVVARRDSDKREKSREVKRRESGYKNKRESYNLERKECDYRNKKPRPSSINDERQPPPRRNDLVYLQRNDSYDKTTWAKELIQEAERLERGRLKTCVQVDDMMLKKPPGYNEIELHEEKEDFRHLSSGVIRLHCNYQDDFPHANRHSVDYVPSDARNGNVQHTDYVELCRDNSVREKKQDSKKRRDISKKPIDNNNKVRRKTSRSKMIRDTEIQRKISFNDKQRTRRVSEGVKHVRRTNSFHEPNSNFNDINYNDSVKLNADHSVPDEHARMDNLVYGGKRDNGNFAQDVEVYPFETFVKPPSYSNMMKHQVPECRDRCKQKKIAITDYL